MNSSTLVAAARFHSLAAAASRHGGLFVSAGGGTANVAAATIARATCSTFEDASRALDLTGGPGWYNDLAAAQPWPFGHVPYDHEEDRWLSRWSVRTIARAAARPAR
jgi:hypothetical protein